MIHGARSEPMHLCWQRYWMRLRDCWDNAIALPQNYSKLNYYQNFTIHLKFGL